MDPQIEYLDDDKKYGVTKADTDMPAGDELTSSMQTETTTESRGLFGFGVCTLNPLSVPWMNKVVT